MRSWALRWFAFFAPVGLLIHHAHAQDESLTLAVSRGPVSLLVYVAEAEGHFRQEGINVRTRECSSGRACFELLTEGSADVATAAELLVTVNSFARPDLALIATLSASANQIRLVARRTAGIEAPVQLAGKRVGTAGGTSAHYFLDSWLLFHEIDPRRVVVVPLAPGQLVGALQRGDVDAVAIWEPLASEALDALLHDGMMMRPARVYTQHFSLVTTRQGIAKRRAELAGLLRALIRAQDTVTANPAKAVEVLKARLAMPSARAELTLKEHDFRIRLDQTLLTTMSSQSRWAVREGYVESGRRPASALEAVEPAILRAVAPSAVTLTP